MAYTNELVGMGQDWGILLVSAMAVPWSNVPGEFSFGVARELRCEIRRPPMFMVDRHQADKIQRPSQIQAVVFSDDIVKKIVGRGRRTCLTREGAGRGVILDGGLSTDLDQLFFRAGNGDMSSQEAEFRGLTILSQILDREVLYGGGNDKARSVAEKASRYIDTHIDGKLTLSGLSKYCRTSRDALTCVFRDCYGLTVTAYIYGRRLDLAKRLVTRTSSPLAEIASQSGFSSQAHMTAAFRKVFGTTPGAMRGIASKREASTIK
ncbi:helix-turn-helix domain-containing protein [Asticcacaulis sp. AC460]|uniref:helix-turn-helix domain-containing protein n=1 Tax=Asticcacaulis sp. AC460 TaxID=1282360 RepID=UPI00138B084F|nr:AraC family transcriptional regulator [Asticcacaulis sp. AC460]